MSEVSDRPAWASPPGKLHGTQHDVVALGDELVHRGGQGIHVAAVPVDEDDAAGPGAEGTGELDDDLLQCCCADGTGAGEGLVLSAAAVGESGRHHRGRQPRGDIAIVGGRPATRKRDHGSGIPVSEFR